MIGRYNKTGLSEEEMAALRKRAWLEQRVLVVSPFDARLEFSDKARLCEIGERLYGHGNPDDNT